MLSEVNIVTDLRKLKFFPIYHSERFKNLELGRFSFLMVDNIRGDAYLVGKRL